MENASVTPVCPMSDPSFGDEAPRSESLRLLDPPLGWDIRDIPKEFGLPRPLHPAQPISAVPRQRRHTAQRNSGGRPTKFTLPAALAIVTTLCEGGRLEDAARAAGVGPSTLKSWLSLGRRGDPRFALLAEAITAASARGRDRERDRVLFALLDALG
jgi:hypothetical protein